MHRRVQSENLSELSTCLRGLATLRLLSLEHVAIGNQSGEGALESGQSCRRARRVTDRDHRRAAPSDAQQHQSDRHRCLLDSQQQCPAPGYTAPAPERRPSDPASHRPLRSIDDYMLDEDMN